MITKLTIEHIVSDSERHHGKPMIVGTGVTVQNIVYSLRNGLIPEQIVEQYNLSPGQVHAALAYYYDHQLEIDTAIEIESKLTAEQLQELQQVGQARSFDELKRQIEARRQ